MSIANYTELKAAVADHLTRSDLTAVIPDLITIGESRLNRKLRLLEMEQTASLSASQDSRVVALPSRFLEALSLRLTASGEEYSLVQKDTTDLDRLIASSSGQPRLYAVSSQIEFERPADQAYALTLRYFRRLDLATDETNFLLTAQPDIYLYSALLAATPRIKNDSRIPIWKGFVDEFIREANRQAARTRGKGELTVDAGLSRGRRFNINAGDY